jgi:folate-dependent phosphoribosylglycinamide formyltransferase PurN
MRNLLAKQWSIWMPDNETDDVQKLQPAAVQGRIVIFTAGGLNPQVMINALSDRFTDIHIIQEQPEPKGEIVRRRARRLGWINAFGQLATMIASRFYKTVAAKRSAHIMAQHGLKAEENPDIPVINVLSLNSDECRSAVADLKPDVVFTISCRILSEKTLAAIPCPVINFHAGINPMYRGQMGGYWSLVENDAGNFGATMHLVDTGVDTGGTLYEQRTTPAKADTMATYPLLLTAVSTGIAISAIEDALSGTLKPYHPAGKSVLRFPPPVWIWLWHGIKRNIW